MSDDQAPAIAGMPADQTITVDFPDEGAVATWIEPTATDNTPGVVIRQIAGPSSGSMFPLGATTVTYQATDANGNTATASFVVRVNQTPPGSVTFVVNLPADTTFQFTSAEPVLEATVAVVNGRGTSGPIQIRPGTYPIAFAAPAGVGIRDASCSSEGSTLDAMSGQGSVVVTSGVAVVCTVDALDSLAETSALIGEGLEARSQLVVANQPRRDRRLERLNGTPSAPTGINAFGLPVGGLPFSANISQNSASFSYSLSRSDALGARPSSATNLRPNVASSSASGGLEGSTSTQALGRISATDAPLANSNAGGRTYDIWLEGHLVRFEAGGGDGKFAIAHGGIDTLVGSNLLVGFGVQFDWMEFETSTGGTFEGKGYMVGPYATLRLSEQLYLDGRLAYGRSSNTVDPFGFYQDDVDAERLLASASLIGEFHIDAYRIRPELRASYYRETTDAYVDSLGVAIGEGEASIGVVEFGPTVSRRFQLPNGGSVEPFAKADIVWTFDSSNAAAAVRSPETVTTEGVRGRLEAGFSLSGDGGSSLTASGYYDGIGDSNDFSEWGIKLRLQKRF